VWLSLFVLFYNTTDHWLYVDDYYNSIQWPTNTRMLKILQPSTHQAGALSRGRNTFLKHIVGYKPAAGKTVEEYRELDAGDDSLARWKASLGLDGAASEDTSLPKVVLLIN
jgi:hypothetical protein